MRVRARILVVEDNAAIRELLERRLKELYELEFAACQAEAYERLRESSFDLVLLDLRLPIRLDDMSESNEVGVDIARTIRRRKLKRTGSQMPLPIVVMTAHGSENEAVKLLVDEGVDNYIPKPFGRDRKLEEKIECALQGRGKLLPAQSRAEIKAEMIVRMAVNDDQQQVWIEGLRFHDGDYKLLSYLWNLFHEDQERGRSPEKYQRVLGESLADKIGSRSGDAVRTRILKFRRKVKTGFAEEIKRPIGDEDIIESRRWQGYRLNPITVRPVAWDEVVGGDE